MNPSKSKLALLYLFLILYAAMVLVPFLVVLSASLHSSGLPRLIPENLTLEHYQRLLGDPKLLRSLLNSFIVGIGSTLLSVLISAFAGYAFSRYQFPGRGLLMGLVLGIFMIPVSVNIIPLYVMLQRLGWLNTYQGLIIPYQALILPLNVWLLKNFFDTIPKELEEAAQVDGATRWTAFWQVVLPLTWPGLAVASIFAFRFGWNDFVFAATFTSTASMRTWQAAMYTFLGLERTSWGPLTAGVVIGMLPVIILFILFQRRFIEGLTLGAVK
ncbi:MAG TPA: carbohydrate ABC transporter permease [Anaerolineales bacterium]|nr:carbohydrate ABC transporter permease [Anaerolineales bacterium]